MSSRWHLRTLPRLSIPIMPSFAHIPLTFLPISPLVHKPLLLSRPFHTARHFSASLSPTTKTPLTSGHTLVIVESPAKANTIQKILSHNRYTVRSCVGHIRELPNSAKRIPAKYKTEPWARIGVNIHDDFKPLYVLIAGKQAIINELKAELKKCDQLILATDEDREGEAISWHLTQVLKPSVPIKRAVFHEITPQAINNAFSTCRDIDMQLVEAQETRRVLDRLAGYTMSPLLWKKICRGLSAGRVQSVAMSVIVRREYQRLVFVKGSYSSCTATFHGDIHAVLSAINGKRMVKGTDFDSMTGTVKQEVLDKGVCCFTQHGMANLIPTMNMDQAFVTAIEKRRTTRKPPVVFITSTLQQECGNRFGMGAGQTMRVAQKLYENGYITYMRTDNPRLSEQAVHASREAVKETFGEQFLGDVAQSKSKPKGAQAAHEAIRPAGSKFIKPEDLTGLEKEERDVYTLIYTRTLASQMNSAKLDQTTVKIGVPLDGGDHEGMAEFRATGSIVIESGFLEAYKDIKEKQAAGGFIPTVEKDQKLSGTIPTILNHETKPPPRFNDASLVKELEELGVGRPSTYASIIEKLITRGYIYRGRQLPEEKKVPPRALVPSLTAFAVDKLLSAHFPSFIDAQFTARMEESLDEIAEGSGNRLEYLSNYYMGEDGLAESVQRTEDEINPRTFRQVLLPNMPKEMRDAAAKAESMSAVNTKASKKRKEKKRGNGERSLKKTEDGKVDWASTRVLVSSYGPYIEQEGDVVASLPKTTLADDLAGDRLEYVLELAQDPVIGTDSESGLPILVKTSRYGPYVQLGRDEDATEGSKPKRCSLFAGMDVGALSVEMASKMLSLPRLLGYHPISGEEIRAGMGPYGPYVVHNGNYVSLKKGVHDVLEIELDEARELIDASEARKEMRRLKLEQKKAEKENMENDKQLIGTKKEKQSDVKQRVRSRQKTTSSQ